MIYYAMWYERWEGKRLPIVCFSKHTNIIEASNQAKATNGNIYREPQWEATKTRLIADGHTVTQRNQ